MTEQFHFYQIRSPEPGSTPLIMTHGYPGWAFEQPGAFVEDVRKFARLLPVT